MKTSATRSIILRATLAIAFATLVVAGPLAAATPALDARHTVVPSALARAFVHLGDARIPSFSRQTKLACSACHYQFVQLTPFGRQFKLNGYTLTGLENIAARMPRDTSSVNLSLSPIPLVSAMAIASFTSVRRAAAGTQNEVATFPDQLSVFLGGAVTPKVGIFAQLTYASADAALGIDNVDIRFANRTTLAARDFVYGVTLHNNPTVQDVWNTVPAWSVPFVSSSIAPTPSASPLVDGVLGQQVLGLGAYSMWNDVLYTELSAYRSAPQGGAQPSDSSATDVLRNVSPYWRVALQRQFGGTYAMVGTYGLSGELYPTGISGPTDRYLDVAADAQLERPLASGGALLARGSVIRERQHLHASTLGEEPTAEHVENTLTTYRANGTYQLSTRYGFTLGWFGSTGTRDELRYAPESVSGSASGRPNSSGAFGEVDVNPWQNLRLGAQYVAYGKFNGGTRSYDGAGRQASSNDALYVFTWLVF